MGRGRIAVYKRCATGIHIFPASDSLVYREAVNVEKRRASTREPAWCRLPQLFMEAVVSLRETDRRKVVFPDPSVPAMAGPNRCCLRPQITQWVAVNLQQRDNAGASRHVWRIAHRGVVVAARKVDRRWHPARASLTGEISSSL